MWNIWLGSRNSLNGSSCKTSASSHKFALCPVNKADWDEHLGWHLKKNQRMSFHNFLSHWSMINAVDNKTRCWGKWQREVGRWWVDSRVFGPYNQLDEHMSTPTLDFELWQGCMLLFGAQLVQKSSAMKDYKPFNKNSQNILSVV